MNSKFLVAFYLALVFFAVCDGECDAKCIKYCAKEFTKDPSGFVQCMKDCGCIPPSEIQDDKNANEIKESGNK
uniref:Uncharacterized protein n=1 Tax=Panagrolaimus superbus TaxID=310955 RepID=A0A914YGC5_9BILA